ncbi:MAG: hypothetical protein IT247_02850 [Bacteroidia bacterium]|nr:hypothetical protein [Bacteroidia bacterium]
MQCIKLLLVLAALSCLSLHCKKESELDNLPPATTNGAETFGCLINGKAFRGDYKSKIYRGIYHDAIIEMEMENEMGNIYFRTEGIITKPGDYVIPYAPSAMHLFAYDGDDSYRSRNTLNGFAFLRITRLDSLQHYIAGQFDFTLFNSSGTASVHVSNGRFDLKYAP